MNKLESEFGSKVFSDAVMQARLPKGTYKEYKQSVKEGRSMSEQAAAVIANAMKDWAQEQGATHFTHWFQPMTGFTAEKHEAFLAPAGGGRVITEFSGKELIKGEPDASSFPSGGLRATFEARGYTAWDPTSPAFIKEEVLCIPTAFYSYTGEALDKKTPLLKSMEALNTQALRLLKLFGSDAQKVSPTVGAEQEYFLIDKSVFDKRRDLVYTGRTLFGAKPPKGQQMDDHYFGAIKPRVIAFMKDLDEELWKLGIPAKTRHNEVAPAQHELAPIFTTSNIAGDHNQLTMEIMKRVAKRHGMECLLHEKPFESINGSGKHNNWSLTTDTGENLLNPGANPHENIQFLLILTAIIAAVDEHQDLLRTSVASAGNDHRLGANEAPPAIISMFLGSALEEVLRSIEKDCDYEQDPQCALDTGVGVLPEFMVDSEDRNRTSPFAFTGNKFEFRMPGSALSISGPNFVLNTIAADKFMEFADALEGEEDLEQAAVKLIRKNLKEHKRILFNGNNYSDEWLVEAEKRGLLNLKTTADALPTFLEKKNIELFERQGVLTEAEMKSRAELLLEDYCKIIDIEGTTMLQMGRKSIIPAVSRYTRELAESVVLKKQISEEIDCSAEINLARDLTDGLDKFMAAIEKLDDDLEKASKIKDAQQAAEFYAYTVLPDMERMRKISDGMEIVASKTQWPWPTYGDILYSV